MYAFKVTAKQSVANGKIPQGMSVQVISTSSCTPMSKEIAEAFKNQLGIDLKGMSVYSSQFTIERLK